MPTVHVSEGPGGTSAPTPSPVRHGTASCGLLVLPQEDLPVLTWCFVCVLCVCVYYVHVSHYVNARADYKHPS